MPHSKSMLISDGRDALIKHQDNISLAFNPKIILVIESWKQWEEFSKMEVLKVSSKSNPNSVAGALAGVLREMGSAEIQVIGAGALNQAIKAIAIARGFVAPSGIDLVCVPAFTDIIIDGEERTAIRLSVESR